MIKLAQFVVFSWKQENRLGRRAPLSRRLASPAPIVWMDLMASAAALAHAVTSVTDAPAPPEFPVPTGLASPVIHCQY